MLQIGFWHGLSCTHDAVQVHIEEKRRGERGREVVYIKTQSLALPENHRKNMSYLQQYFIEAFLQSSGQQGAPALALIQSQT